MGLGVAEVKLNSMDPTPRILLLCARLELSQEQREALGYLCTQVEDWNAFLREAHFRLIVPLVHRHLSESGEGGSPVAAVPEAILQVLKEQSLSLALQNLRVHAVQQRLVQKVLGPLKVEHLFVKGLSLAERYYPDPSLRMARDVDVLVPTWARGALYQRFVQEGFQLRNLPCPPTSDALAFYLRFKVDDTGWLSREGVLVEPKTDIDKAWGCFPSDELLRAAEVIDTPGGPLRVLPTTPLFVYVAYHHTRHLWARLHWLADIDAMVKDPTFDEGAIRAYARTRHLEGVVSATLALHAAAGEPDLNRALSHLTNPLERKVFRLCLMNLEGDRDTEVRLRSEFTLWTTEIPLIRRLWVQNVRNYLKRFRPKLDDYEHLPLPASLHSLYYLLRPSLWLLRKFRRS